METRQVVAEWLAAIDEVHSNDELPLTLR